jgi:hypothetical protein
MEFFGLIAFVLVLANSSKFKKIEREINLLKGKRRGTSEMTKLISDLKGQSCIITCEELDTFTGKKVRIECEICDIDNEWVKVTFVNKKGISKTKIIRLENIYDIELL